jgi:hypothetical protein
VLLEAVSAPLAVNRGVPEPSAGVAETTVLAEGDTLLAAEREATAL